MDKGFPKRVDEGFPGMTGKVTAAFQVRGECDTASKHTTVHYKPSICKYTMMWNFLGFNQYVPSRMSLTSLPYMVLQALPTSIVAPSCLSTA